MSNLYINAGASYQYSGVLPPTLECERRFDYDSYKMFSTSVNYQDSVYGKFGIYPYNYWQAGAYALMDFDWNRLTLNGGVRFDYNSQWGRSLNPRFAAQYWIVPDRLKFRASQAYAYKIPSPGQYYYSTGVAMQTALGVVTALHHVPSDISKLKPESISSTEFGLSFYIDKEKGSYLEVVGYTNIIRDPLVRAWVKMEECGFVKVPQYGIFVPNPSDPKGKYYNQGGYYVGVTDFFSTTKGRDWTRAFKNETNAKTKLYGLQLIGRFADITKENFMHLSVSAALTFTLGKENLSNNDAIAEQFIEVDYIRGTPKYSAQVSVECNLDKRQLFHIRFDNMYCSKFARMYYQATDNPYFWSPSYYTLDCAVTGKIGKNLTLVLKLSNITNTLYAGIDVKAMDVDMPYNPQQLRTFSFGATYDF